MVFKYIRFTACYATDFFESSDIVVSGESIIFSTQSTVFSFNLNSGSMNWEKNVNSVATPIIDGDYIFVVTKNGYLVILNKKNAEYVDLLNFGLDENHLLNAGFLKLNFKSKIIVPNYFEPFMQQNKLINYAYLLKNNKKKFFIYKADGDQERPNKLLN